MVHGEPEFDARGQVRRVRMVVYRRAPATAVSRRGQSPEQSLCTICDRLVGGLANAGVKRLIDVLYDLYCRPRRRR